VSAAEKWKSDYVVKVQDPRNAKWLTCTIVLDILSSVRRYLKCLQLRPRLKASSKLILSMIFDKTSYGKDIKPNIRPFRGSWTRVIWMQKQINYTSKIVYGKEDGYEPIPKIM
jgi:hypothetical protein